MLRPDVDSNSNIHIVFQIMATAVQFAYSNMVNLLASIHVEIVSSRYLEFKVIHPKLLIFHHKFSGILKNYYEYQ